VATKERGKASVAHQEKAAAAYQEKREAAKAAEKVVAVTKAESLTSTKVQKMNPAAMKKELKEPKAVLYDLVYFSKLLSHLKTKDRQSDLPWHR